MLRVPIAQARTGMRLAVAVTHPRLGEVVLLREGVELDAVSIPRLRSLGVPEVWIHVPGLEDLVRFVDPRVLASYRELTRSISHALDSALIQSRVELDFWEYKRGVMSVLDRLVDSPSAAVFISELVGLDQPFVRHAGSVAVLSILMGIKLDFYLVRERSRLNPTAAKDISGLGVGAMLADIGMTRLNPACRARWAATHDEEDIEWQKHVTIGFDMVKADLDPGSAAVVLHHHQKFDGSGFPGRRNLHGALVPIKGSEIHVFARIAAAADLFDRLRHPVGDNFADTDPGAIAGLPPVRALRLMREKPYVDWVDPVVKCALFTVQPAYPPGSMVTLNDGRRAVVVDWAPTQTCRPTVEVFENDPLTEAVNSRTAGGTPQRERVNLASNRSLWIVEADGVDVSGDNFDPAYEGEFDLTRVGRAMMGAVDAARPEGKSEGKNDAA